LELNGSILKGKHNEVASNEWKLGEKMKGKVSLSLFKRENKAYIFLF